MILKVILVILLCLVLLLLFYPLRIRFHVTYAEGKDSESVTLHPIFMMERFGFTLYDSEKPKKEKRKKAKKKESLKKEEKPKREMKPLNELILHGAELIHRFQKGLIKLRVRLAVSFGFADPAVTGEVCGAVYATLPAFFHDMKRCRWRFGLFPIWSTERPAADVDGDIRACGFEVIIAFGKMIPEIFKIMPKKKKRRSKNERTSHRQFDEQCPE